MFTVSSGGSGMEAATPVAGPAAPAAVAGPSSVAAYVASRWDATPVVGVPSSADAAKNASKAHGATRNRWDETPATEGPSSRWDAATPQLGKQGQAEPGTASKKRSRWDETPVAGGPAGGSLVAARYDTMNPCCEFIERIGLCGRRYVSHPSSHTVGESGAVHGHSRHVCRADPRDDAAGTSTH